MVLVDPGPQDVHVDGAAAARIVKITRVLEVALGLSHAKAARIGSLRKTSA